MTEQEILTIVNVEGFLHQHGVFVNGFTNEPAHMNDDYTVVDYKRLEGCMKSQKVEKIIILTCINHWTTKPEYNRPIKLVAQCLKRWVNNGAYNRILASC